MLPILTDTDSRRCVLQEIKGCGGYYSAIKFKKSIKALLTQTCLVLALVDIVWLFLYLLFIDEGHDKVFFT